jgi:alternative ribosome-rescue factor
MSRYQHTKGQIKDNAIERSCMTHCSDSALRKIRKGKEVIYVKANMAIGVTGRPVARK